MAGTDQPLRLLLVDDEPDILISLETLFKRDLSDVVVLTARSGAEALDIIRRRRIALMLTDYKMPGMDGFQLVVEARKIAPRMPVIMMTAYPNVDVASRAVRDFGVGLMVVKPFDLEYLVGVVRAILREPPVSA